MGIKKQKATTDQMLNQLSVFSLYTVSVYQCHCAKKKIELKMFMLKFNGKEEINQLRSMVEEFIVSFSLESFLIREM